MSDHSVVTSKDVLHWFVGFMFERLLFRSACNFVNAFGISPSSSEASEQRPTSWNEYTSWELQLLMNDHIPKVVDGEDEPQTPKSTPQIIWFLFRHPLRAYRIRVVLLRLRGYMTLLTQAIVLDRDRAEAPGPIAASLDLPIGIDSNGVSSRRSKSDCRAWSSNTYSPPLDRQRTSRGKGPVSHRRLKLRRNNFINIALANINIQQRQFFGDVGKEDIRGPARYYSTKQNISNMTCMSSWTYPYSWRTKGD
ncbi:hypothetical protein B0T20DRAFT_395869 [Sordaria brevicollis]|uniref:Uncharacterized protein n=1 Tax=Sordaria brevicollis TaxID=83679 RepID=A0AAE0P2G0_SORBR|nr:hypothetical protein B0T20DRAFT_395869 [Sordaria brevicollis]